jgi:hypothetical protein
MSPLPPENLHLSSSRFDVTKCLEMSGLVSYDSSSEEDGLEALRQEIPIPEADHDSSQNVPGPPLPPPAGVLLATAIPGQTPNVVKVGPMLGPAIPQNTTSPDTQMSSPSSPAELSEQDTVRYLTQAPVPATSLPPSPPGSPDPAANARFRHFLELKAKGVHFNEDLAKNPGFQNSSLLSTMMARAGINEREQYNTSLSHDLWDPTAFPEWAYKEGLLKSQTEIQGQNDEIKKSLSATGKRTIDFTSETKSSSASRASTSGQRSKRGRA